jgi:hypothetical protein
MLISHFNGSWREGFIDEDEKLECGAKNHKASNYTQWNGLIAAEHAVRYCQVQEQ